MAPATAQDLSVWFDASTSHTRPPADVAADPSQFALLGVRADADFDWGAASVAGRFGDAVAGSDGRWLQGSASIITGGRVGSVGFRALASGFGLRYLDPFTYTAGGVDIQPSASVPVGRYVVSARPQLAVGGWSTDALEGDLQVAGGDVAVHQAMGALTASVRAGARHADNGVLAGTVAGTGATLLLDRGRWTLGADLEVQRSPLETELGGGLRGSYQAAPGLDLSVYAGRRVRDVLFGTAGSLGFSIAVAYRAGRWSAPPPPAVASVGAARDGGRVVRFAIRAPEAAAVELAGDFTDWEPVSMAPDRDGWWRAQRVLDPGLHHFGFLVDGQWVIPPEAPGVVDDGWGRRNASIVVEP